MKIYITRQIPDEGINLLKGKGYDVVINPHDRVLSKDELIAALSGNAYDAVLCLLTDTIDADIFEAAGPQCRIFANYAVGFDNIDLTSAAKKNIIITNTPGVLTNTVAEHTFALMLAISRRIAEADAFTREGKYIGWAPMLLLGNDFSAKTLGIVGLGRIGSRVAHHAAKGFEAKIIYHDVQKNADFEKEFNAVYKENLDDLLAEADYVSIHVPLLDSTRHLIDARRLGLMKPSAYLINTSRGAVIDETALSLALQKNSIKGAAIDVFEHEPSLAPGLSQLKNIIMTPHIASGTEETRQAMSRLAAENIIAVFEGKEAPNKVAFH